MKTLENIVSFRHSSKIMKSPIKRNKEARTRTSFGTYAGAVALSPIDKEQVQDVEESSTPVVTNDIIARGKGAVSREKRNCKLGSVQQVDSDNELLPRNILDRHKELSIQQDDITVEQTTHQESENKWNLVDRNRKRRLGSEGVRGGSRLVGARRGTGTLKAVRRTADVFIGRLDTSITAEDVATYIDSTFDIMVYSIQQLDIISKDFVAFKVNVNMNDRTKLFNSELWPEDVIVDKYFNRNSTRV